MSLKSFHIFFVCTSLLLSLGFAMWSFREYTRADGAMNLIMAGGALLFTIILAWYGKWFLRKLKGIN